MSAAGIQSFLMLGQSNMAGRGDLGAVPDIVHPDILMLREQGWAPMREPINPDRPFAGVGLAASFAEDFVNAYGGRVGLIPCADGGTCLDQWAVGGALYNQALRRARQAQQDSRIVGILWHQGENDSHSQADADAYEGKFSRMMDSLVRELGIEDVPLVLGEIGEFAGQYQNGRCRFFPLVNQALHRLAQSRPHCAIVPAAGLTSRDDLIHFDSPSCRIFGRRYFAAYQRLRAAMPG